MRLSEKRKECSEELSKQALIKVSIFKFSNTAQETSVLLEFNASEL